jgi:uncharacterized integral membrane protein (TIGR00698 family)
MRELIPGVLAAAVLGVGAWLAGPSVPLAGAPLVALAAGALLRNLRGMPAAWGPGVEFTVKRLLKVAIVLFGATLSLGEVVATGGGALLLIAVTVLAALLFTTSFGAWLRAPARLTALIGVGTAICGATAIITIGPIVQASAEEITFAVTTIFLFNALAVAVYPVLGHLLGLSDRLFGLWAGTAIHDTSSVLAAAYAYSDPAGQVATVVKLTRTLMLVPLALAVALAVSYRRADTGQGAGAPVRITAIFPWFVLWFAGAALLHSVGVLPPALVRGVGLAGKFLVVMVMAAVGLGADAAAMRRLGVRPLLIGLAAAVLIAVLSLTLARWLGS